MRKHDIPDPSQDSRQKALQAVQYARLALQNGDRLAVRRFCETAIQNDPTIEDPWLYLAAVASPQASLSYLRKALEINPTSQRAQKGIAWASGRLNIQDLSDIRDEQSNRSRLDQTRLQSLPAKKGDNSLTSPAVLSNWDDHQFDSSPVENTYVVVQGRESPDRPSRVPFIVWYAFGTLLFALGYLAAALSPFYPQLWKDLSDNIAPYVHESALMLENLPTVIGVDLASHTPTEVLSTTVVFEPLIGVESTSSPTPYQPATSTPTELPSPTPTITPIPTETPIPLPTSTPEPSISATAAAQPTVNEPTALPTRKPKKKASVASGPGLRPDQVSLNDRWVDVDLSSQQVFAMEGSQVARSFTVSTGLWPNVTVTGTYKIYVKYRKANMSGDGYNLPNVPYVMYFYKGYGLHGTYWHNNFGSPMSHGCVNLRTEDAAWLFDFASVGTIVSIHP